MALGSPMQRLSLLIAVLLSTLALAGCLGGDDDGADDVNPVVNEGNDPADNNTTTPDEPVPVNTPPTAGLTADLASGDAPLVVTFNLTGADADGDALSWTLDADGDGTTDADGTALPRDVAFNYTAAGNHTAVLAVTDGTDGTSANLTITVTEPAPADPQLPENINITDSITGVYAGVDYVAVEPKAHNWSFAPAGVTNMTVFVSFDDPTTIDLDWKLIAPDGTEVVLRNGYNLPGGVEIPVVGGFAAVEPAFSVTDVALLKQTGEWVIEIYPGESVQGGYTVQITFA